MTELELLNVVEYSLRAYHDSKLGNKFGLMEYYSITDLDPNELSKLARMYNKINLSNSLLIFNNTFYWLKQETPISDRLKLYHSVSGHELTSEEKLTICDKLKEEGFPLMDGVYDYAARLFVTQGIDAISRESISEKVIAFYNKTHKDKMVVPKSEKILVK